MIRNIRKCMVVFLALVMSVYFASVSVLAEESTLENQGTIHGMGYKIYDREGNLVESGIMPKSEAEAQLRVDYGSRTLRNGESMLLDNYGTVFIVPSGAFITMGFGLNRNATVSARIYHWNKNKDLNSWTGFTGGTALNARATESLNAEGYIQNLSSDPITVNWAYFRF